MHPWFRQLVDEIRDAQSWQQRPPRPCLRYAARSDAAAIAWVERAACLNPWGERGIAGRLNGHRVTGKVAVDTSGRPVAWCLVGHTDASVRLLRLAVHPLHRRLGIARALLEDLVARLDHARPCASALVPDHLLDLHLTLRACRWRAMEVVREESGDLYRFSYWLPNPANVEIAP